MQEKRDGQEKSIFYLNEGHIEGCDIPEVSVIRNVK